MFAEGNESISILSFILFIFAFWLVLFLFGEVTRRLLKVERKKMFSNNYVNPLHKKIDRMVRYSIVAVMIIGGIINIARFPATILFLEPYFLLVVLIFLSETVTVVIEYKYVENRNAFVFTLLQLAFIMLCLVAFYFWFI